MGNSFRFTKVQKEPSEEFFNIHQHHAYELVCIIEGSIDLSIDFQNFTLKENSVYLIKPNQIHQWAKKNFPNTCKVYIYHFLKDFFLDSSMVNKLFDNNSLPIIEISPLIMDNIKQLSLMIEQEDSLNQKSSLLACILNYVLKFRTEDSNLYYKDKRVYQLFDLIEKNFKEEKQALFYANAFELSTKRLNELCKLYLNKTLSSLIIDRNIVEIKRELSYGNLSIKEIAAKLKFNDPSSFSKFFKKHTSYSPLEFKEKNL